MPRILGLALNRRGTQLVVNCSDRTVRIYDTHKPAPDRRHPTLADLRNRASAKVQALLAKAAYLPILAWAQAECSVTSK